MTMKEKMTWNVPASSFGARAATRPPMVFASSMACVFASKLIELIQISHLDFELQSCSTVATGKRYQQACRQVPGTRRLDLPLDEVHRALTVHG